MFTAGSDCTQLMSLLYCSVVDAAFTNCDITQTGKLLPLVSAATVYSKPMS